MLRTAIFSLILGFWSLPAVQAEVVIFTPDKGATNLHVAETKDVRLAHCVVAEGDLENAEKVVYIERNAALAKNLKKIFVSKTGDVDPSGCL